MNSLLKHLLRFQREVRDLNRIMPFRDAWRLAGRQKPEAEISIYLIPAQRNVIIRPDTSDLECLKKIFLSEDYCLPFKISPKVIVDAGANIGMATLYFATRYPEASIIAIEPESSNFKILEQNCAGLPNVTLLNVALWPSEQSVQITNPGDEKWSFVVSGSAEKGSSTQNVPIISVEGVLRKTPDGNIDLLKLDIEGAEWELFSINPEKWLNNVQTIAIELHDRFRNGCAQAFYSAIAKRKFRQEVKGENIFVKFDDYK